MDNLQQPAPRTSSRTLAIAVVAVLIAVAVAGIMMAVLRDKPQAEGAVSASSASASAPKAKLADAELNRFDFKGDSDQLSPAALEQAKTLGESLKGATSLVVFTGKIETTSERAAKMDLVKKRINAVRRALQGHGVAPTRFRVEVTEYPVGRIQTGEADRIEIVLR